MKCNFPILSALLLSLATHVVGQNPASPAGAAPAAQAVMQKWLSDLDAQWQAVFKRDVTDPFTAELEKLRGQYLAAIEAGVSKASGAGDLNAAIAWRNEQKRFTEAKNVPAEDAAADPLAMKQIRSAWRTQFARMERDRATRAKALVAKYDQALAQAQTQLTKVNRLDDALLLKAKRNEVASGSWPEASTAAQPPATGAAPPPVVAATPLPVAGSRPSATVAVASPKPPAFIPPGPQAGQTTERLDQRALEAKLKAMRCLGGTGMSSDGTFSVTGVVFGKRNWTMQDMAICDQLDGIRTLSIEDNSMTDAMLERMTVCRKLMFLNLIELPNITARGIQLLVGLPELRSVSVARLHLSDAALKSAFENSNLDTLELTDVRVTDATLAMIGALPKIRIVGLHSIPGLTAAGWEALSKAGQLRTLRVSRIHPGPDAYAHLAQCQSLDTLELAYTPPTDAEVQAIGTMKQLKKLTIRSAKLSGGSIASLKAALPSLAISVDGKIQ